MPNQKLLQLLETARECRLCEADLPSGCRPVLRASESARLLVVGQAPGRRVHASGIPWDDPSGERLRHWMGTETALFYDASRIAIIPMGLCYPGKGKHGDLPPDPRCAPLWHTRLRPALGNIELTLLIGQYAQKHYLGRRCHGTLTETVRHYRDYLPEFLPMPHPSPRNMLWLKRNPWFEADVVPWLRARITELFCLPAD